jgi:predicted transcriptional regulator
MALHGNLRDFSISDIFQLIGLQRKTGVLTLKSRDDLVTITFLDGRVVDSDSEKYRLESRLGKVLLKRGTLSDEKLGQALKIQQDTLQRLGYILVKNGFISNEELKRALTQQILEIVYRIFRWREGEYNFSQETSVEYDRESITPITTESILMEGAQMLDEWPIIERQVKSMGQIFEKTSIRQRIEVSEDESFEFDESTAGQVQAVKGETIKLSPAVHEIYGLVDGNCTVAELVERSRQNEFQVCKALYELVTRGLVEEKREKPAVEAVPTVDEVVAAAPEAPRALVLPLVLVAVVFLLGNLVRFKNPLNRLTSAVTKENLVDFTLYNASFARLHLVDRAIQSYYLTNAANPGTLSDLVAAGFVSPDALQDPWKRSYIYHKQDQNYYLIGHAKDGKHSLELIFTYILSEGMDKKVSAPAKKPVVTFLD